MMASRNFNGQERSSPGALTCESARQDIFQAEIFSAIGFLSDIPILV